MAKVPKLQPLRGGALGGTRSAVRKAVVGAVAQLLRDGGIAAVTMPRTADAAGMSPATLDKYFSEAEILILAWREQQVSRYLAYLRGHAVPSADPMDTLQTVLEVYSVVSQQSSTPNAPAARDDITPSGTADEHQQTYLTDLIQQATHQGLDTAASGRRIRTDLNASQLAAFALHAVHSAAFAPTPEAARALARVIVNELTVRG
ncbi:TetR/AcrR family transcriptional regulator [Arthrobacter sp. MDT1-65]